jgi:hypothetical protein
MLSLVLAAMVRRAMPRQGFSGLLRWWAFGCFVGDAGGYLSPYQSIEE